MAKILDGQLPFPSMMPESDWKPPDLNSLPSWRDAKRVAVDCETRDEHLKEMGIGVRRGGYICGISFAIEDGPGAYLPVRHAGGNLDPDKVREYLQDQAKVFRGDLVGAHLPYDLDYLEEEGVSFQPRRFRDVQVAAPLLYEHHMSYSLEKILEREGLPGKDETLLRQAASMLGVDPKGAMHKIHSKYVGPYGEQDTRAPLHLLRRQERQLEEQGLWDIYELESKITPILVRMRRRGVLIDQDHLEYVEKYSLQEKAKAIKKIHQLTGVNIGVGNLMKAERVAQALEYVGIPVPRTPKTNKPSVKAEYLEGINHPVCHAIVWGRRVNKLRTTFAASVRQYMTNGRIHCTINQLRRTKEDGSSVGTISGRCSSTDPNMQQQLARDKILGPLWRKVFIPDQGGRWGCLDFSQQEPRLTVHFAHLLGLEGATEARNAYINDPRMDYHQFMADITGLERKVAKNIFLGLAYGMGGGKLCRSLHLPTKTIMTRRGPLEVAGEEGQKIIDQFDERAPFVRKLSKRCERRANEKGQIKTLMGFVCRFKRIKGGRYDFTHEALNRLIQGSAAGQTKAAMIAVEEAGYELQFPVHDELDLTVESREEGNKIAEIMENCVELTVPSRVDVEIGNSWGEIG